MSARVELVFMVVLFSSVLAASIKESEENLSEQAECSGVCSLARDKASKTGVKVLRALSCYHCVNRRKGKTWRQERIQDRFFLATTFTKRHRRSLFLDPSLPKSSTALKPSDCVVASDDYSVPEMVMPSKVDVTFGKYENTSYWYVNVSWTPIEDSSGQLYGTLLDILVNPMKPEGACTVLRMNQTFLNINISFYGYSYPNPIYLSIRGLPYRRKVMTMTSYMPSIPTSSNLTTLISTTGIPASSTLHKTAAFNSDSLDSSSSSKGPTTTTFGTECGVSSPDQSVDWTPSVVNVTFGQYENTRYWYVNVSWTPLNDSYGNWTDILVKLLVLTSTSDLVFARPVTCSVHPKNLTFLNINISSHHYEYPSPIFLKVVALPYSPKEDNAHIPQYHPPASILSKPGVFPTTTPGKSKKFTVTVYVSMAAGILAGIILGAVWLKCCLCRKKSSYFPPVICAWRSSCRPARAEFDRLNSTTSTATEISLVSLNKGRLI